MAWEVYIVPIESVGSARGPKYFPWRFSAGAPELAGVQWAMMDYGAVPFGIVAADVTPEQDDFLNLQADVRNIPTTLDNQIGGALNAVQNALEAARIPAGWVSASTTWRELLRAVCGLFQFAQRFTAITGNQLVTSTSVLNLRLNQLSQANRDAIEQVAAGLGYTTGFAGNTTVRTVLKSFADQWGAKIFTLGGLQF